MSCESTSVGGYLKIKMGVSPITNVNSEFGCKIKNIDIDNYDNYRVFLGALADICSECIGIS